MRYMTSIDCELSSRSATFDLRLVGPVADVRGVTMTPTHSY